MGKVGRLSRRDGEAARQRLLARTRDALRKRPKIDLHRVLIAGAAEVAPSLVSYYYPDKWDLFSEAARPVVQTYVTETRTILQSATQPQAKLFSLIQLFVKFNFQHGFLLDFYLENIQLISRKEDFEELQSVYKEMMIFFNTLIGDGVVRGAEPALVQSSLWGACKYVAQQPHLSSVADQNVILRKIAEGIFNLVSTGLAEPNHVAGS